jgi:hypothetical protein
MEDLAEMSLTIGNMKKGGRSPFLSVILWTRAYLLKTYGDSLKIVSMCRKSGETEYWNILYLMWKLTLQLFPILTNYLSLKIFLCPFPGHKLSNKPPGAQFVSE